MEPASLGVLHLLCTRHCAPFMALVKALQQPVAL